MANIGTVFRVRITGTRPLMSHPPPGSRRGGEIGRRLKELNALRKPTEADIEERDSLKYVVALYCDPDIGPYLPGLNLWAAIRDGAKIHRLGTAWVTNTYRT